MPGPTDTAVNGDQTAVSSGKKPRGRVAIRQDRCKGCAYCVEFCPLNVLVMSTPFNAKGYHYPQIANGAECSGCDLCGMYCPDFAITGARIPGR
ncbi:MAG: 4Fe-4S dicluster domain-containing protein [bacterium]|nr:4Fe-4S dicluster domain-containing protein [bacterium]